jgi:putative transferase (TIGR04331 family)
MINNLVTTAIRSTWDKNANNILINQGCKCYKSRSWLNEYNLVEHKIDLNNENSISKRIGWVSDVVLYLTKIVGVELNRYHGTKLSDRHWRILLGHWMSRYVSAIYYRYKLVSTVLERFKIDYSIKITGSPSLFPAGTGDFIRQCDDDYWNHFVFVDLLKDHGFDSFINVESVDQNKIPTTKETYKTGIRLKWIAKRVLQKFSSSLCRNNQYFLTATYLPWKYEVLLNIALGQLPCRWEAGDAFYSNNVDTKFRARTVPYKYGGGPEGYISKRVFMYLPKIFLEDFNQNWTQIGKLGFPKRPKVIFASNNFDTNELMKMYIVKNISESDSKYIVGQHGANYGSTVQFKYDPEYTEPDAFISWGWSLRSRDIVGFNFRTVGRVNSYKSGSQAKILLVGFPLNHNMYCWDIFQYQIKYHDDQIKFLESLTQKRFESLEIRLHGNHKHSVWCDKQRFEDHFKSIRFAKDGGCILSLYQQCRLVVHSYDSTGILECLSMNVPMIAFWSQEAFKFDDDLAGAYKGLYEAGIVYVDPIKAAEFVNSHYDKISEWWNSRIVRKARMEFCDQFSRSDSNPIIKLSNILSKI